MISLYQDIYKCYLYTTNQVLTENVKLRDERERHDQTKLSVSNNTNQNINNATSPSINKTIASFMRPTLRKRVSSWPVFLNTLELETDFNQDAAASAVTNPKHHQQVKIELLMTNIVEHLLRVYTLLNKILSQANHFPVETFVWRKSPKNSLSKALF